MSAVSAAGCLLSGMTVQSGGGSVLGVCTFEVMGFGWGAFGSAAFGLGTCGLGTCVLGTCVLGTDGLTTGALGTGGPWFDDLEAFDRCVVLC